MVKSQKKKNHLTLLIPSVRCWILLRPGASRRRRVSLSLYSPPTIPTTIITTVVSLPDLGVVEGGLRFVYTRLFFSVADSWKSLVFHFLDNSAETS